jgi:hypothetical protein
MTVPSASDSSQPPPRLRVGYIQIHSPQQGTTGLPAKARMPVALRFGFRLRCRSRHGGRKLVGRVRVSDFGHVVPWEVCGWRQLFRLLRFRTELAPHPRSGVSRPSFTSHTALAPASPRRPGAICMRTRAVPRTYRQRSDLLSCRRYGTSQLTVSPGRRRAG